jgi:plasmid stabilization system protein ParE
VRRARFLKPAEVEANEAVAYFDEQRLGLGDRFEQDLFATVTFVTQHPLTGRSISDLVRHFPLRTFRYHVIYVVDGDEIVIVAVAHQRRRPRYWQHRLATSR